MSVGISPFPLLYIRTYFILWQKNKNIIVFAIILITIFGTSQCLDGLAQEIQYNGILVD